MISRPWMRVPTTILNTVKQSCTVSNVRGAGSWRSMNDGKGHRSNIMESLVQGRKAEWYVWKILSTNPNIKKLSEPNFNRDQRASFDMSFQDLTGKRFSVEVKSCAKKKRDRNGYQFQIRRKYKHGLRLVDPYIETNCKEGGNTLFYCVIVDGVNCRADTIFGTPRKKLICSDPNRKDLKGLKLVIHPRYNSSSNNITEYS